jgi:surface antigen
VRAKAIYTVVVSGLLLAGVSVPAWAIQCAIYARAETGVSLYGDAGAWWGEAAGRYSRGHQPVPGAILVFKPSRYIHLGHVAVVAAVVNRREILVDQANWNRGQINHGTPVVDRSPNNDWTDVSVENLASHTQGRDNPTFGFVYPQTTRSIDIARREDDARPASRPMLRTAVAQRAEIDHLVAKPVLAEISDRDLAVAERENLAGRPIAAHHAATQPVVETRVARPGRKDRAEKRVAKAAGRKRLVVKDETKKRVAEKAVPRKHEPEKPAVAKAESGKRRLDAKPDEHRLAEAAAAKKRAAVKTAAEKKLDEKRLADAHRPDARRPDAHRTDAHHPDTHRLDRRLAAKKAAPHKDEKRVAARAPAKHEATRPLVAARAAPHRVAPAAHLVLATVTVRQPAPKPHPSAHAATPHAARAEHPRRAHVAVLLHDQRPKSAHRDF